MKTKHVKWLNIFSLTVGYLALMLISACRKDIYDKFSPEGDLTVTSAREYFNENFTVVSRTGLGKSGILPIEAVLNTKEPIWDKAFEKSISIGNAIKIPLDMGKLSVIINQKTGATLPASALNYLLMYKDSSGAVHTEWIELAPDSAWLYGKRGKYSGSIVVKSWEGKMMRLFKYGSGGVREIVNRGPGKGATTSDLTGDGITTCYRNFDPNKCQRSPLYCVPECDLCFFCTTAECITTYPPVCVLCDPPPLGPGGSYPGGSDSGDGNATGGGGGSGTGGIDYVPCTPDPVADDQLWIPCNEIPEPTNGVDFEPANSQARVVAISSIKSLLLDLENQNYFTTGLTDAERELFAGRFYASEQLLIDHGINNLNQYLAGVTEDDPSLKEIIIAKLRKYFGLDAPEDAAEAVKITNELAGWDDIGRRIKAVHDMQRNVFGFIPGFLAIDDMIMGSYGSAAVNGSLDLFGGQLLRFVKVGLPAAKTILKVSEFRLKYPNIVGAFKELTISEICITKGSNPNKIILIGEGMDERVNPFLDKFNKLFRAEMEKYTPSDAASREMHNLIATLGRKLNESETKGLLLYAENKAWLKAKLAQGYTVVDIGSKNVNQIKSYFYEMERSLIYH